MSGPGQFENVGRIVDCVNQGKDANHLLDGMSNQENRELMRLIREGRNSGSGNQYLPDLTITINSDGIDFNQKGPFPGGVCEAPSAVAMSAAGGERAQKSAEHKPEQKAESHTTDPELARIMEGWDRDARQQRQEATVTGFTDGITGNVGDCMHDTFDQTAKLELRQNLMKLKEQSPEVVEQVMTNLEKEFGRGQSLEKLPVVGDLVAQTRSGMDVTYAKDQNGNDIKSQPLEIHFKGSFNNGVGGETIYMNKTLAENAEIARAEFKSTGDTVGTGGSKQMYELNRDMNQLPEEKKLWFDRVLDK
ncbi:MAG: hypothetical protein KC777_01110 [Cyanobacteria bacterium HKST-UBA02]|nr:hypothetical protein [Cyanobacteria bacterium HKST-UBA02]